MSRIVYLCADRGITLSKHNGATAHLRSMVGGLVELGHDVLLMTPSDPVADAIPAPVEQIPTPRAVAKLLADVAVPAADGEVARRRQRVAHALAHALGNVVVERSLIEVVSRFRPDAVIEMHSPFAYAGSVACRALGVRHVLNVHAPLAWEGATFRGQALPEAAELLEERALASARRIVTNSAEMRAILLEMGADEAKVSVIANGVDTELFAPDGPDHRSDLPEGAIVVGFCGSLKAWHGIDLLVEAFRMVSSDHRLHLLVVGDGPERRRVKALAAELPGRVTVTGAVPLPSVPAWIRTMDIAAAPYPVLERFYFSPLKSLEYMAAGRATVSSAIGQLRDLVSHGRTGLLVPPGDPDRLAAAIGRLANDAPLRSRLGSAAVREARAHHAWKDRIAEIVEVALSQPAVDPSGEAA